MLLLVADSETDTPLTIDNGVPGSLIKWAEEGFTVVEIKASALSKGSNVIRTAIEALKQCAECDYDAKVGVVVIYADEKDKAIFDQHTVPTLVHLVGTSSSPTHRTADLITYYYANVKSSKFATPFHHHFHYGTEAVSHTRNLAFLKPRIGGPYFDLEAIWEEHTYYEFADRSVEHTMSTMVQEPYVNHVPTVEVPFTAVVNIRGDRLYHEHIAWDQCTVLRQLGLLPEYLPFPHPLPEGHAVPLGATVQYRVPASGIDIARKMRDKNSVDSNGMFNFKVRTE
ncbi:hypothetical protein N0V83_002431 [Neocucurbitaria cava]|uniref:Carboxymethylenebutenolidase n=1 Tax=Neocucurbitaria cava TaxID=798079 RepID=A0A9W8YH02_9PLEO|nr:hypothetical protein N0V83_002431 [Neocucurbitaria cava]